MISCCNREMAQGWHTHGWNVVVQLCSLTVSAVPRCVQMSKTLRKMLL